MEYVRNIDEFIIGKSSSVIYCIDRIKEKNDMIISINAENAANSIL